MNHLRNKNISQLTLFFRELDEPKYRGEQAFLRLHKYLASNIDEFSEFSLPLRSKLKELANLSSLRLVQADKEKRGTEKVIFELEDKNKRIETVWIVSPDGRNTLCVSSQIGCNLHCSFCATATLPFRGNLQVHEILEQVYGSIRHRKEKLNNIVFMGMGEPFYNYENVIQAAQILSHPKGLNIGVRHITISTAGVIPSIERFIEERQPYNLAVSLNHTNEEGRLKIMDVTKKYSLKDLLTSLRRYTREMNRRVTLEYVLIPNINMSEINIKELVKIAHSLRCHINLIPLNTNLNNWKRPSTKEILSFQSKLRKEKIAVFNRGSLGHDVNAACGMLALSNYKDKEMSSMCDES